MDLGEEGATVLPQLPMQLKLLLLRCQVELPPLPAQIIALYHRSQQVQTEAGIPDEEDLGEEGGEGDLIRNQW